MKLYLVVECGGMLDYYRFELVLSLIFLFFVNS